VSKNLEIKKSTITGAGLGAFARSLIKKGEKIGEYTGELLTINEYESLKDKSYIFEVGKKFEGRYYTFYINGKNKKYASSLRYINGAYGKKKTQQINCEAYQYAEKIFYRATKNIKPGEELFVDYGDSYWEDDPN
jgi:SET domain-containing protein